MGSWWTEKREREMLADRTPRWILWLRVALLATIAGLTLFLGVVRAQAARSVSSLDLMMERTVTSNTERLNALDKRMDTLESAHCESRLATLEAYETTNLRILVGILLAVVVQFVDLGYRLRRRRE